MASLCSCAGSFRLAEYRIGEICSDLSADLRLAFDCRGLPEVGMSFTENIFVNGKVKGMLCGVDGVNLRFFDNFISFVVEFLSDDERKGRTDVWDRIDLDATFILGPMGFDRRLEIDRQG